MGVWDGGVRRSVGTAGLLGNLLLDDVGRAVAERTLLLDELLELRDVLLHGLDAARVVVTCLVDCLEESGKGEVKRDSRRRGCALARQTLVT